MTRILVVDDNEHNREYVRQVLVDQYEITSAADGVEALAEVAQNPPDLMLLDLSMPRLDGWAVVQALRQEPATAKLPIVACSAHAMPGDQERALAAGFDAYLTKPFRPEELLSVVTPFVGSGGDVSAKAGDDDWGGDDWRLSASEWDDRNNAPG